MARFTAAFPLITIYLAFADMLLVRRINAHLIDDMLAKCKCIRAAIRFMMMARAGFRLDICAYRVLILLTLIYIHTYISLIIE